MFKQIRNTVTSRVGGARLKAIKYTPEMGVALGLVALGASAILLARAHKRSGEVHLKNQNDVDNKEIDIEEAEEELGVEFNQQQRARMLAPVYSNYAVDIVKLYGPAVIVGAIGTGLVIGAHRVQRGRIQGLAAALLVVQQGFEEYRKRVITEQGEDADRRFLWGLDSQTVNKVHVDENGKKRKTKVQENRIGEAISASDYNRIFDHTCPEWFNDGQITNQVLATKQSIFNEVLQRNGFVFLNDVYKSFGFEPTRYGQVVGWSLKSPGTDGFISFGLDNPATPEMIRSNTWLLEFNVDGEILNLID